MSSRLTIIFIFFLVLIFASAFSGRYLIYGLEGEKEVVRITANIAIEYIFGWDYQEKQQLSAIDYLLFRYENNRGENGEIARYLMSLSCAYVENKNNSYDASLSFINAMIENDEDIIAFWLSRGISLDKLKISSEYAKQDITVARVLKKFSFDPGKTEMVKYINNYTNNIKNPVGLIDPCERAAFNEKEKGARIQPLSAIVFGTKETKPKGHYVNL